MKILQEFKNEYNNITYRLYELDCGIKLIHLENPATVNFDFYSIQRAGSIYENMAKVPHGSAHLMEHMLCNPNTTFRTQDDIYKFQEGDKTRPTLNMNASTWYKHMDLRGSSNIKGAERILERINSMVDFPIEKFRKSLVNEKRIVTAERSRRPQIAKDHFIQKMLYLEGKTYPEFAYNIIGEVEEIKNISIKDLKSYFTSRFLNRDAIFAIQSDSILSTKIVNMLEEIGKKYTQNEAPTLKKIALFNKLTLGYFYDEKATGTTLELNFFDEITEGFDYKKDSVANILNSVIRKIGQIILREKKGLIYGLQAYREDWFTIYHNVVCLRFIVENSRVTELLANLNTFIFDDIEKFIKSDKGTRWINNILSNYIYPTTIIYDQELPYEVATNYSEYHELYNYNKYVEEVKKITKKDLLDELKKLQSTPPHIWVESNLPKKEVEKIVKESSIWKRFK
ncbi:insulinase family protein [Patescibacteria group bacterium]|nr:insulinase family protein [Patescibacteria group bacterium]